MSGTIDISDLVASGMWPAILSEHAGVDWVICGFPDAKNGKLVVQGFGKGGLREIHDGLDPAQVQYGGFKVTAHYKPFNLKHNFRSKFVFFSWAGPKVGVMQKARVANQRKVVKEYFKGVNVDFQVGGDISAFGELEIADKMDRSGSGAARYDFHNRSFEDTLDGFEAAKEEKKRRKSEAKQALKVSVPVGTAAVDTLLVELAKAEHETREREAQYARRKAEEVAAAVSAPMLEPVAELHAVESTVETVPEVASETVLRVDTGSSVSADEASTIILEPVAVLPSLLAPVGPRTEEAETPGSSVATTPKSIESPSEARIPRPSAALEIPHIDLADLREALSRDLNSDSDKLLSDTRDVRRLIPHSRSGSFSSISSSSSERSAPAVTSLLKEVLSDTVSLSSGSPYQRSPRSRLHTNEDGYVSDGAEGTRDRKDTVDDLSDSDYEDKLSDVPDLPIEAGIPAPVTVPESLKTEPEVVESVSTPIVSKPVEVPVASDAIPATSVVATEPAAAEAVISVAESLPAALDMIVSPAVSNLATPVDADRTASGEFEERTVRRPISRSRGAVKEIDVDVAVDNILKEGLMLKHGESGGWKKRYLVVTRNKKLHYFYDEEKKKLGGTMHLETSNIMDRQSVATVFGQKHIFQFEITSGMRSMGLAASSQAEKDEWMSVFHEVFASVTDDDRDAMKMQELAEEATKTRKHKRSDADSAPSDITSEAVRNRLHTISIKPAAGMPLPVLPVRGTPESLAGAWGTADDDKDSWHRRDVYCEIIDTERGYVRDLSVLVNIFLKPLQSTIGTDREIVTSDDIKMIFMNIEQIMTVNAELLTKLESGMKSEKLSNTIATSFTKMEAYFRIYSVYCNGYHASVEHAQKVQKANKRFAHFLSVCQDQPICRGLDIVSFLIKPVQRICKYPLFFRDVLGHMSKSHPCREAMEKADKSVNKQAGKVNSNMEEAANVKKVFEIYQLWGEGVCEDLVMPGRMFLMEEECKVRMGDSKSKELVLYLFSDLVLIMQKPAESILSYGKKKYKVKHRFVMEEVKFQDVSYSTNGDEFNILYTSKGSTFGTVERLTVQVANRSLKEMILARLGDARAKIDKKLENMGLPGSRRSMEVGTPDSAKRKWATNRKGTLTRNTMSLKVKSSEVLESISRTYGTPTSPKADHAADHAGTTETSAPVDSTESSI